MDEEEEAVLIYLDTEFTSYEELISLEDDLSDVTAASGFGSVDGHEIGKAQATIYIYSTDADMIFVQVRPHLQVLQVNRNCKVLIRRGCPGAPDRTVDLDSFASSPA